MPAHFSAEAAVQAQRLAKPQVELRSAKPEVLAGQAVARPPEEAAARDVVAVPLRVAGHAAVARLPVEPAALDAAEEPRREAEARVAAAVLRPEAAVRAGVAEVARQPAARDAAVVRQRAAPGVRAAARPSAVLSVFHRDRLRGWPEPSPAARFAYAMETLQIASP